jgi:hypothetical protein
MVKFISIKLVKLTSTGKWLNWLKSFKQENGKVHLNIKKLLNPQQRESG